MKILAIIPARGGSKKIPKKNIKKLNGKPLIYYSINNAKKSKLINRVIVSTDDIKIAKIAEKYGAEVPFLRPRKISGDTAKTIDVIKHTLKFLEKENYKPDIITILQPTTPLRKTTTLDKSIKILKKEKPDIVLGVIKIKTHPYRSFWLKNKSLKPFRKDFLKFHQRQSFPECYYPTGGIYTFWNETIKKYGHMYGPKIRPLIMEKNEPVIDIDTEFDFYIAETYLQKKNKKKIPN